MHKKQLLTLALFATLTTTAGCAYRHFLGMHGPPPSGTTRKFTWIQSGKTPSAWNVMHRKITPVMRR